MIEKALDLFKPGRTAYIPGASGESQALIDALRRDPARLDGVHVVSCQFPGINEFDYAGLHPTTSAATFLPPAALRSSLQDGRAQLWPLSYFEIAEWLQGAGAPDIAFAHVSPPDESGSCSLGVAVDFTPIAWAVAKQRVLLVNPRMPAAANGSKLELSDADIVADADGPVLTVPSAAEDEVSRRIGERIALLVPEGAAIEIGLGSAPASAWRQLANHRRLRLVSGLIADGFLTLLDSGAVLPDGHVAGVALSGKGVHDFLAASASVRLAAVTETHDVEKLKTYDRFTAINGAIEVDLFGQINLEWRGEGVISGVGGAPDFARAAMASKGGRSITALPATARKGAVSRIVPRLEMPPSLGRRDADTIVTEFGVAELRGKPLDARAEAIIAIAAPDHRNALAAAWDDMRRRMWAG